MQQLSACLALAGLSAAASAQVNPFVVYPQDPERQTVTCTSFLGRPDLDRAAEALVPIDQQHFRGVGDANGGMRLFGVFSWAGDERLSTAETYDLVVRSATAGNAPDMSAAGELLRVAGLTTPPSVNPARGSWILYDGFNLQGGLFLTTVPAVCFVGVGLPANPLWPATDGYSLFRADMLNVSSATVGENHRLGAPNPTWAGTTRVPAFTTPWTYILGPLVTSPNLHVGGIDPTSNRLGAPGANLGMNGLFPDIGGSPRRDGILVRITDNLAPYGLAFLAASPGFRPPFYLFGAPLNLIGQSWVGDTVQPPTPVGLGALQQGACEFPIALPGTIPTSLVGVEVVFQGIVADQNLLLAEWTDAQAVHL